MNVVIEDNKYIEKFMKHHNNYSERLKDEIYSNINTMINEKAYKIKDVRGLKYRGKTAFEYKIILDKYFVCRIAYIKEDDNIVVFYISTFFLSYYSILSFLTLLIIVDKTIFTYYNYNKITIGCDFYDDDVSCV